MDKFGVTNRPRLPSIILILLVTAEPKAFIRGWIAAGALSTALFAATGVIGAAIPAVMLGAGLENIFLPE